MARYIDADKFAEWIDAGHLRSSNEVCLSENNVLKMIELQPTADVAEVKHGEWEYSQGDVLRYGCSLCGERALTNNEIRLPKYCGGCGAKMDGKDGDGE